MTHPPLIMRPTIGLLLCVFLSVFSLSHAQVAMDPQYQAAVDTAAAALAVQKQPQQACPPMSKEVFAKHAREGVVLITVVDHIVMKKFGESFVQNIMRTNISYWFVAALDPWTSLRLGSMGPEVNTHCFNAPQDKLGYKGSAEGYAWGSNHWRETTWNKVHVLAAEYELGFHVVHSDTDTTWFNDPWPFITSHLLNAEVHAVFSTDGLVTKNEPGDHGLEVQTDAYTNINTGVYMVKQYPDGNEFFKIWKSFQPTNIGHDQDGLNAVVRGEAMTGDKKLNPPHEAQNRVVRAAQHNKTLVSLLPISMFANAYTFGVGNVAERLGHPLYEVHWVWSGSTMESKQQNIRDAGKYWDPPQYYGVDDPSLMLLTIGPLWRPKMPKNFNIMKFEETEQMIQFHLLAADTQLRQAYYGFLAAMALNRTFVLPKFDCFCAKNWYMTQKCRINGEPHTMFPYTCGLSNLMRAKRLLTRGLEVENGTKTAVTHVKEFTFLSHSRVPPEIKNSRLELIPSEVERPAGVAPINLSKLQTTQQADGSTQLVVPWPLHDGELNAVLNHLPKRYRVVHLANASMIMGKGFRDGKFHDTFDQSLQKLVTYWCCRSPHDMKTFNLTDKVQLDIIPLPRASQA